MLSHSNVYVWVAANVIIFHYGNDINDDETVIEKGFLVLMARNCSHFVFLLHRHCCLGCCFSTR